MMKSRTLLRYLIVGLSPFTSTSFPQDVIYVISVPRPSPFFAVLPLLCIILNANQGTKNGGRLGMRLSVLLQQL